MIYTYSVSSNFICLAPEVLSVNEGSSGYGKEVDCWAIGVIAYIL
ncbi:unnamed protein product [Schistosoma mattheei]|uniref:Uncharacterized protein n=1 Tax=Schistosoma mattheei TaxID=31246 RepID=A0A183Q087_9TREM|nr:unnamed protein product [Schistosoma mattheei]